MSFLPANGARPWPCPRLCDLCNSSKAFLYCRADSARLCFNCDREAHFSNPLFQKHARSLLCDGCDSAPCSIFCSTESTVLCQNCDWELHGNFVTVHDRRPIEGFSGCPSFTELLSFLGLEDLTKKSDDEEDGWMDLLVWETASVVNLDNAIVTKDSADSPHSFQAMDVPPLPKNRNAICGKHKEDILRQLREMATNEHKLHTCVGDFDESGTENCAKLRLQLQLQAPSLPVPFL